MRIAVNAIPLLSPLTGVGVYTYQTLKNILRLAPDNEYRYYYGYFFTRNIFADDQTRGKIYKAKETVKHVPGLWEVAKEVQCHAAALTLKSFDLYFEPNFIPLNVRAKKTVVSIMDFSFEKYPEWHPKERIKYFTRKFRKNIGRADRIIAISDFVRDEAVNEFGLPAEKVNVVRLGFNQEVFRPLPKEALAPVGRKYALPEKFILCVGSMEPRKNLLNLLKAYTSLPKSMRNEFKLVFAGFKGWENREIMDLISKVKEDVVYLGYVTDAELGAIYNLASLFVYPSFYEGFGLPPLEAMACGCPVVVSRVASLPEVCGEAAVYVEPAEVDSIAAGMRKALEGEELRKELRAAGLARSGLFSWEKTAAEHLRIFGEVVKS